MKKIFVILVLVLSPFAMGLYAQCPDGEDFKEVVVSWDKYPVMTDPTKWGNLELDPNDPPPPDPDEVRRIYFVHGLGGNNKAWAKPAAASKNGSPGFPRRKCETTLLNYSNNTANLLDATNAIRESTGTTITIDAQAALDRQQGIIKPSRSIIIAHGQGGLLSRELMHLDIVVDNTLPQNMDYGGVITIASPLQGARILDNNRKLLTDWATDACRKIGNGSIRDDITNFLNNKMSPLLDGTCQTNANTAMPMFFNSYYNEITKDYTIGSSMMSTLNQDADNANYRAFHKMAFYAVEPTTNLFWRTLRWMTSNPDDLSCFQANDDWETYNEAKKVIDKFQAQKQARHADYIAGAWTSGIIGVGSIVGAFFSGGTTLFFLIPAGGFGIDAANEKAKYLAYSDALEWFNNANKSWEAVIGTDVRFVTKKDQNGRPTEMRYPESDGVVDEFRAKNMPYATHEPIRICPKDYRGMEIGSSHMQVRNDKGLKDALNDLYNGKYDKWFFVAEDNQ